LNTYYYSFFLFIIIITSYYTWILDILPYYFATTHASFSHILILKVDSHFRFSFTHNIDYATLITHNIGHCHYFFHYFRLILPFSPLRYYYAIDADTMLPLIHYYVTHTLLKPIDDTQLAAADTSLLMAAITIIAIDGHYAVTPLFFQPLADAAAIRDYWCIANIDYCRLISAIITLAIAVIDVAINTILFSASLPMLMAINIIALAITPFTQLPLMIANNNSHFVIDYFAWYGFRHANTMIRLLTAGRHCRQLSLSPLRWLHIAITLIGHFRHYYWLISCFYCWFIGWLIIAAFTLILHISH